MKCVVRAPRTMQRRILPSHPHHATTSQRRRLPSLVASSSSFSSSRGGKRGSALLARAAAFDGVTKGLDKAWQKLKGEDALTRENIAAPLKDIRRALLEADVSLPVVRRFVKRVEERAVGVEVATGLKPDEKLVAVVRQELVKLMGGKKADMELRAEAGKEEKGEVAVILLAGLQGVGKTTMCGKLAARLEKEGRKPMLIAGDIYRPAAIDQLQMTGEKLGVPVYSCGSDTPPEEVASLGIAEAQKLGADVAIVDTAGRLQIDDEMMAELKRVKEKVNPDEILLVVDAMTGQEAPKLVKAFNDAVGITGSILTKLDGDTRGGAAISAFEVSQRPIKFVGTGEKTEDLEPFFPERMADRILGMGDILTLVDKMESAVKEDEVEALTKKLKENKFDYDDFLKQSEMMGRMGALNKVAKMIPGLSKVDDKEFNQAERNMEVVKTIIRAMTAEERSNPDLLVGPTGPARRRRIAAKADVDVAQVQNMIGSFAMMRQQMSKLSGLMREADEKGMVSGASSMEMMKSVWKDISEGKVRRRKKEKKTRVKAAPRPKRGFGQQKAETSET